MLWTIIFKTIIVHTLTYFIVGLLAYRFFNYKTFIADSASNMRPTTHPFVRAGVLFQPIRGFLFGIVFYLLSNVLFLQANGWLIMWVMLVVVGIFSPFAPAPASIEGFIYTQTHKGKSWLGLLEILLQSFLLSFITYYWVNHPTYFLLSWMLSVIFILALVLPIIGLLIVRKRKA